MKNFFRTILLLGVLGLSVLVFLDFMNEKNILPLVLIIMACLLTIRNIISVFVETSDHVEYLPGTVLLIFGVLYYLSRNNYLLILIFLQVFDMAFQGMWDFICCTFFLVSRSALIVCIFRIVNNNAFDLLHIGILIASSLPIIYLVLEPILATILGNIFKVSEIIGTILYTILSRPKCMYICGCIILILSIILKVTHIDDSALFYGLMGIISIIGRSFSYMEIEKIGYDTDQNY